MGAASFLILARDGPRMLHAAAIVALLARALLALGRREEAAQRVLVLGARGFADVPDFVRVGTLASLAETAARLGRDPRRAGSRTTRAPSAREENARMGGRARVARDKGCP